MAEPGDDEQDERSATAADDAEEDRINDPLARTDVDAPQVPFGPDPEPEE